MTPKTNEDIIAQLLLRTYDRCFVRGQVPPTVGSSIAHYDMFLKEELNTLLTAKDKEREEAVTTVVWEDMKDELYTYFGRCDCGASCVIVGSKYCSECGKRIVNPLRSTPPDTKLSDKQ